MAVYNRLGKGSPFEDMAVDYSVDRQSAGRGGDIGYFSADQVELPFAETVKKLKEGSYSKPVRTSYGFHIIKLTERIKAGSELDSAEAKKRIQNQLLMGKEAEGFNRIIDSLRTRADIETYPLPGPDKRILQDGQ
jgi:foldase protein PrsA